MDSTKQLDEKITEQLSAEATSKIDRESLMAEALKKAASSDNYKETLLEEAQVPPKVGDLVEGPVIAVEQSRLYIDLHPFGTGLIFGREFSNARDVIRNINVGDDIAAKIVEVNGFEGYMELSLREARQALVWAELESLMKEKAELDLVVTDANKGGLIIEWKGILGFLPASQLKSEHYPRIDDGDKQRILEELRKLVGERLTVSVLTAVPKENKLIFTERDPKENKEIANVLDRFVVGDEIETTVTGVVDFGVFVRLEGDLEGLVHISELDWSLVEDPREHYKAGEKVKAKIIEIKEGKVSLSIKALKPNPWEHARETYKKGDTVEGIIIKYNKHGALAAIEEGVAGLIHHSEFGSQDELKKTLELGKKYSFVITIFDAKDQRMALSYKQANS